MSQSISIKHGRELYTLEVNPDDLVSTLRAQIYSLTNVPPENQKLIGKGMIKDDSLPISALTLPPNKPLTLIGSAISAPIAVEKPVFLEDIQKGDSHIVKLPGRGCVNLGNTCYLSSVLQALARIPHLLPALQSSLGQPLLNQLNTTLQTLQSSGSAFSPSQLVTLFRNAFPQFNERTEHGFFAQQDAEEALESLLSLLRNVPPTTNVPRVSAPSSLPMNDNLAMQLFGLELSRKLSNTEAQEVEDKAAEVVTSVKVNITSECDYLEQCLEEMLSGHIEKNSQILGRNAVFKSSSLLNSLPPYLFTSFVRFEWREDIAQRVKILKKVTFPMTLDLYEYCTEGLKSVLQDKKMVYRLTAVVAHKGRSAEGGHYMSYVKTVEEGEEKWVWYDDAKVALISEEKVKELSGGGDLPIAYILLYSLEEAK
ncbi:hypothetical protein P9112_003590 [Eukaryota sp. TZLM1-RC]